MHSSIKPFGSVIMTPSDMERYRFASFFEASSLRVSEAVFISTRRSIAPRQFQNSPVNSATRDDTSTPAYSETLPASLGCIASNPGPGRVSSSKVCPIMNMCRTALKGGSRSSSGEGPPGTAYRVWQSSPGRMRLSRRSSTPPFGSSPRSMELPSIVSRFTTIATMPVGIPEGSDTALSATALQASLAPPSGSAPDRVGNLSDRATATAFSRG
ncbi:MAG: hypothetical protein BWY99_02306 [Synergistetes bacterium ADurb.BinA166]|nr:MAG: hypothetical protein BWY99_02306 [Synergistetes bacterium ADurb.BinA166]